MQTFTRTYQLGSQSSLWHTFPYTIKSKDAWNTPLYQVRRSGFRKYRQFEDTNENILFYIGVTTIKSVDKENTLATMLKDGKTIKTVIGNFTLIDLDIFRRNYILKINNNVVAQVKRKWGPMRDRHIIDMNDINEQYQAFVFALFVLIDSFNETMLSPTVFTHPVCYHTPNHDFAFCMTPSHFSNIGCCSSGGC